MSGGYRVEGLVLTQKPLGEKDRVVTLLTADRGLLRLSARGGRTMGSKFAALILPFSRVRLEVWRGRSLDGLRGGGVLESHRALRENPSYLGYAYCTSEIVTLLAQEGEADRPLYLLLNTTWRLMSAMDPDLVLAFFLVRVTKVAGLFPDLEHCRRCGCVGRGGHLSFSRGTLTCDRCSGDGTPGVGLSPEAVNLARLLHDVHPRDLPQVDAPGPLIARLREAMLDYLEHHLGRAVNSRRFLDILA